MGKYDCADRMCGALDCSKCHPENFKDGVYLEDVDIEEEDIEDEEEGDEEDED